ncbi:5579_t:CDS:2 [Acaulospora morrowiae]|uniref:5579_t:CDS:1 n=1 Tax=Acaulospora morrowiae TaxID=94023 RepID=A0A9N9DIS8_9GLOM|nr:5579_t:CDS:2 [Acaulospora morrowiae]
MFAFVIPQLRPDISYIHTYPLSSSLPNTISSSTNTLSSNMLSQQQQASKRRRRNTLLNTMANIGKQEDTIKPLLAPRARSRTINFNEHQNQYYDNDYDYDNNAILLHVNLKNYLEANNEDFNNAEPRRTIKTLQKKTNERQKQS